jgi:ferredoxin-NADP reductase
MQNRETLTAHLRSKRLLDEASHTWHLSFEAEAPFSFIPGQFLSILSERPYPADHARAGETRIDTRAYSLASAPAGKDFDLCVNCLESADGGGYFSNLICSLQPESEIKFHGPHGNFTLRKNPENILILAEETGIAPVRSMLQQHKDLSAHLIQVITTSQKPIYADEFRTLAPLKYEPINDDLNHSKSLAAVKAALASNPQIREAYIVGLSAFVNAHRAHLKELGWDRKQIVFERYD